jgi:hypothetical protein
MSARCDAIGAELSLRGIEHIHLPPELKAAIQSLAEKTERAVRLEPEVFRGFLDELAEFEHILAKPKN